MCGVFFARVSFDGVTLCFDVLVCPHTLWTLFRRVCVFLLFYEVYDFFLVVFGLVGGCFGVSRPSNWLDVSVTGRQGRYHGFRSGHIWPPGGRSQPLHPGQGERPDRGPDHCRGSAQGETHPAEGATPTQGPRSYGGPAIPPREVPLRWLGRPHGLRGQRPLTGPCHRSQEEEMAWDDGAGIDAGCWSERRIPPPRR